MSDYIECDILIYRDGVLEGRIGSGVTSVNDFSKAWENARKLK